MDDEKKPQAGDTGNVSPSAPPPKSEPKSKKSEGEETPDIHDAK